MRYKLKYWYCRLPHLTAIVALIGLSIGCRPTKYVPSDKYLLNRVKIHVDNRNIKSDDLKKLLTQKANKRILGLRFYLSLYNMSNIKKDSGINKYLRNIGEEPVIWDQLSTETTIIKLKRNLNRRGYLNAEVTDSLVYKKRKLNLYYNIRANKPYTIRSLKYSFEDTIIKPFVLSDTLNSKISKGTLLDEDKIADEKVRIEYLLRDKGFFRFNREFIFYSADSSLNTNQVDLTMNITNEIVKTTDGQTLSLPYKRYKINQVEITTESEPNQYILSPNSTKSLSKDSIMKYGIKFIYEDNLKVRPKIIQQSNFIYPDSMFRVSDVEKTKIHLSTLNIFSIVNVSQFKEATKNDTGKFGYLDCQIKLTLQKTQSLTQEIEGTNSSGNIGGAISLGFLHRSLFGGAENFSLKFRGAIEAVKPSESSRFTKAFDFGVEATLSLPQFLIPFNSMNFRKKYNPKTSLTIAFNAQNRPYYEALTANMAFGYIWKTGPYVTHVINPIELNFVYLPPQKKTAEFDSIISGTYLEISYRDHLITDTRYSLVYNNQNLKKRSNYVSFRWNLESAGNILTALNKITNAHKTQDQSNIGTEEYYMLFKNRYAQYLRSDIDIQYFTPFNENTGMVYRFFAGTGVSYGNSSALPFEKLYFSGGANSIRGWQVKTLGPGNYMDTISKYPNSTGDLKLEANMEYRFKIYWVFDGAVYLDAGNIWLLPGKDRPDEQVFKLNNFYKAIAVGSGFGLRFNLPYFLFRIDPGIKVYDPAIRFRQPNQADHPWIFSRPLKGSDFALNIAINYPF